MLSLLRPFISRPFSGFVLILALLQWRLLFVLVSMLQVVLMNVYRKEPRHLRSRHGVSYDDQFFARCEPKQPEVKFSSGQCAELIRYNASSLPATYLGTSSRPRRSGESAQPRAVSHPGKNFWRQEAMHVKKSKMGFRQGVEEISLSKEAREDCNRSSVNERINVNSDMTGFSSATVSHRFATLTADLEAKNDQIGDEMHESDDVARKSLCANGLLSRKDSGDKLLSKESSKGSLKSAMESDQLLRKSKTTVSPDKLLSKEINNGSLKYAVESYQLPRKSKTSVSPSKLLSTERINGSLKSATESDQLLGKSRMIVSPDELLSKERNNGSLKSAVESNQLPRTLKTTVSTSKLLSKERVNWINKSAVESNQSSRKSEVTVSASGLSSLKELDESPSLQETEVLYGNSDQLKILADAQTDEQHELRMRLCNIFGEVLVVDNITLARKVVHMLTHEYRHHVHACDTEVSKIDVKQETPVDHGEIICFSIYSGKDVDYGNGKTCIWVDVLDGGGKDLLAEFAQFFEDPSIKKVWHNYSFDCHVVENYGIKLSGFHADTMHMARLWDSSRRTDGGYSLEALTSNPNVMFENGACHDEDLMGKISMKTIFGRRKMKKDGSLGKTVTLPSVEELQREERKPWICYSSLDSMSTLKLYDSLKSKLSKMPWIMNGKYKGSMLDFYENYWQPFGKILVQMETEGMLVDRAYLSEVEKVAIAQQQVAADRFRNWTSKYCPEARYMNVGSDAQLRTLLFGGICNRKDHNQFLPTVKKFRVPNVENVIEEGKKTPKKYRDITLHKIGSNLQTDFYTLSGWPSVSGDALKAIAGKVSVEYDFSNDASEPPLEDDPQISENKNVDISAYGTAYAAFGGGHEGMEACHAIASLCEICSIDSLISNFILPLQGSHVSGRNGRIHCSLNINTETGRLSARRPNLQNQPALEKDRYKIRQAFVAAPGNSLIVADYGQLELRILAHLADCKSMKEAFEAGGDFHSRTAMNMYPYIREAVQQKEVILEWHPQPGEEKPPVPLLKDAFGSERRKAKMLNFSIAYGKTPMGLAKDWKVSVREARETVDLWYKERQEVLRWQEARKKEAAKIGCVHTLLGRARRFPSMAHASPPQRSHIERAAINTPVQGSAADVAMCAMLEIDRSNRLKELGWKLLLQVHDEVILEGPSESAEEAKALVVEYMSKPFDGRNILTVELAVDAKCAQNWYAAK
ncbi:DNA polymerase I A, chloroplastic/mitochondrial isoform X2 [Beta vulgaris subsp. vulgaris]|uniref:DNA polymerase I A, chloroplastic/mitochondrial isoform X2 n=1 Tax=Beta vulgaris subsp. vulgaris TaxID=3555 RepID=UPI002036EBCD|nr:DNA polymerase I A, chloroplastic/mitochondrial isoform X2 [Beta vulgaris subsp. vulgaris]